MVRLKYINKSNLKDSTLIDEVQVILEREANERNEELRARKRKKAYNPWREFCKNYSDLDSIISLPPDVHNAIAINLFCIDETFESRSIDFLDYAFKLFPDRDYIILT